MEGQGRQRGGEPLQKRPCLEKIWYKLNCGQVHYFPSPIDQSPIEIAELAEELKIYEAIVKHNGTVQNKDDVIPVTSASDPLHFITEVVLYVKVKNKVKLLTPKPNDTVGRMVIDDNLDILKFIVFFEDNAVSFDTIIHMLFGKTTALKYLEVMSQISVKVMIKYQESEVKDVKIEATSSIRDLVRKLRSILSVPVLNWKCESKNMLLEYDGVEVEDWDKRVVDFSRRSPFFLSFKSYSEDDRLNCAQLMAPASTYAVPPTTSMLTTRDCNKILGFCGTPMCNHREEKVGNDVTLYYPPFQDFMDDCKNINPTSLDCTFAMALCTAMSKYYYSDGCRVQALHDILEQHLPQYSIIKSKKGEGKCDIVIDHNTYIEGKNEVGAKGAESFSEVISYWANDISSSPNPAFLVELIGPHLIISGAVYCKAYYVDRLVPPLWLVPQTQNQQVMIEIARVLAAFKKGIQSLQDYYHNPVQASIFPAYKSFPFETGRKNIEYEHEMKRHLFQGTVDGEKVVVKFCETYSAEAHRLLKSIDHAPRLYYCEDVSKRFKMVVMEFVEGTDLKSYLRDETDHGEKQRVVNQCGTVVKTLHHNNLCHGDFREVNVLVRENKTICVIDYDWAGKLEQSRYPLYLNHVYITWPKGATDGALITKEHDLHWLAKFEYALHRD